MPPRLHVDLPLAAGAALTLPDGPARHVRVLRLQPGSALTLFDGRGGEWSARVGAIGRAEVVVELGTHDPVERELASPVTLALGMPANDRMDFVIEKATELGASALQPLVCERSVLRLDGDRAAKKVAHWQAVAIAAAEQSGRTRVPRIEPVRTLSAWLASVPKPPASDERRWLLGFEQAQAPWDVDGPRGDAHAPEPIHAGRGDRPADPAWTMLSGPEGGLTREEETAARRAGFATITLGPRVLRADTAPLALLAWITLRASG